MAVVLLVSAAVAKAQPHLLFHAPFDGHAKAICAGGEMAGEAATGLAYAPGKVSQAWQARAGATCTFPSAGLFTGDEGTFECWVQPAWDSNDGQKHYLLADDSRFVKIYKHSDGRLYVQVRLLGEPDTWISAGGRIDWKAGQWHHVVVAWSGVTDRDTPATAAIHVDGVLVAWHQAKGALAPLGKRLWIGSDAKGGDSFEGLIDEVKLHAKALVSLERPTAVATKSAGAAPMDDPYLSDTLALPRDVPADPLHHLDTVQATPWGLLSRDVAREVFGDSAEERVIFRDSVTGAEVWLLTRLAGEEGIAYTNYYPYNADGSLVRIWGRRGLIMRPDGRLVAAFADLIPHEFVGLPQWSKTDPNVVVCQTAKGGLFEFNLKTKERRVIYMPDDSIPDGTVIQFSDDRQHSMFITKQGRRGEQWMWLGDGNGQNLRKVQMKSRSPKPEQDKMGSASFIRDQHGQLYARYSLNKGSNDPNTPYQNWLVTLDGASFREMDSHNNLKDGTPLRFIPAGTFIVTGHGGYSPSGKHFVHHKEKPGYKWIRDLATWTQRDIARIPGCDHMDWTVDDNWFFVWAMQVGLPIYKTYVDTGVVHRIVCTNSCPHTYGSCPYHGSSPDGTKLVYQSSMLGNNDVYQAIVKHPEPPVQVTLRREGQAVVLTWQPPKRHKEIHGYNVYRAARSASGYVRLNRDLVDGLTFTDPAPPKSACYAITSVEHSGLESRVFSTEVATDWSHGASIYIEAEDGKLTPPMREVFLPNTASANHAITRAVRDSVWNPAEGIASADWTVAVPANGDYAIWARMRARRPEAGPVEVSVAGRPAGQFTATDQTFQWKRLPGSALKLNAGPTALSAKMPASGVELDKWLLTTDRALTPISMGNWPSAAPSKVTNLAAKLDRGCVVLRWKAAPEGDHYQVYRGDAAHFEPTQRQLLGSPSVPAFADPGPWPRSPVFYKVVAVDAWGNASPPSDAASAAVPDPGPTVSLFFEAETGSASASAKVIEDSEAEGGKAVAFGEPDAPPENAGELAIPIDAPPGNYAVWLRVKGSPLKSTGFFYVRLGPREHYSRMNVWFEFGGKKADWLWRRVTFLNTVQDPQEAPMTYQVAERPATLRIRHRANYMAIDRVFLTSSPTAQPIPNAGQMHPGCPNAFPRQDAARP